MTDKLKGLFHGCSHHGDDYEACIQHSGTAPCGVEEERDALAAHVERMKHLLDGVIESDLNGAPEWDAAVAKWLKEAPETSLAQRDARMKAEALESAVRTAQEKRQTSVARWLQHMANNCRKAEGGE